ncbi:MAG: DEAD/DEAH box helicase [Streptococcaceae bacterium]|jgi:transposase|nr:DEAD/DEAH box helicase [Streptococcaceae bacterium]
MSRKMPAVIRSLGEVIAKTEENITIVSIDAAREIVEAKVKDVELNRVILNELQADQDHCDCKLFAQKGYCEHIAAVEAFFRNLNIPLNQLFTSVTTNLQQWGELKNLPKSLQTIINLFPQALDVYRQRSFTKDGVEVPKSAQKRPKSQAALFFERLETLQADALFYEPDQMRIEFELSVQYYPQNTWQAEEKRLYFAFKVGKRDSKKAYVVKDYHQFFQAIETEQVYKISENNQFALSLSSFDDNDTKLLQKLISFKIKPSKVTANYLDNPGRYLPIPPSQTSALLELITKADFKWVNHYDDFRKKTIYQEISYQDLEPEYSPIHVFVSEQLDGYDLSFDDHYDELLEGARIIVKDNIFWQLSERQFNIYRQIKAAFAQLRKKTRMGALSSARFDDDELWFEQWETSELVAICQLLAQIATVELPSSFKLESFTAFFQLKRVNQELHIDVAFKYGNQLYSDEALLEEIPFVRQHAEERFIFKVLRRFGYQITALHGIKDYPSKQALIDFFTKEIPRLRKLGTVELDESVSEAFALLSDLPHAVSVEEEQGLLSVNFEIKGIDEAEIDQVLSHLENQAHYFESANGKLYTLDDDELTKIAEALKELRRQSKIADGRFKVSKSQALLVEQKLKNFDDVSFDYKLKQMTHDLSHPEDFEITLNPKLNADLRPYQIKGIQFLSMLDSYGFGGILADEMGLGKTLQTIAFLMDKATSQLPCLIVCPASLIYNWQEEFAKFAPNMDVVVVDGTKEQRIRTIEAKSSIYITSYQAARSDIKYYELRQLSYLILDEAQFVKNTQTKINQKLRELSVRNVFALSGTPIENRLEELWAIMSIVMPGLLPSKREFNQLSAKQVSQLVKPFIIRREKEMVLTELPEKIEKNLYNELSDGQKIVYLAQLKQMQVKVRGMSSDTFVKNKLEILTGLTRLRQICDTPKLYLPDFKGESGKLEQLKELLFRLKANGSRPLIFSQFTGMLDIIEAELKALDWLVYKLTGAVKPKTRFAMVEEFNAGNGDAFLISLKAGGTGLNLTGSDTVILLDLWWNPAVEDQATARAHRFGQQKNVEVIRLITKGTIEEEIYKLQEKKRDLIDQVLSGTEQKGSLTEAEVRMILGLDD